MEFLEILMHEDWYRRPGGNESRFIVSLIIICHGMILAITNCFKTIASPFSISRSLAYQMELLRLPLYSNREISDELVKDYYRRTGGPEGFTAIIHNFLYFPVFVVAIIIIAPWVLSAQQIKSFFSYTVLLASIAFLAFVLLSGTYS